MLHRYSQNNIVVSITVVLAVFVGCITAQGETASNATAADKGIYAPAPKAAPAESIAAAANETSTDKNIDAAAPGATDAKSIAGPNPVAGPTIGAGKTAFIPYIAEVTADNVYIRSGPAVPYPAVGKFVRGQHVVVRKELLGKRNWAMIEPTAQCFSYIAKKYVKLLEAPPTAQEQPATGESADKTALPISKPNEKTGLATPAGDKVKKPKIKVVRHKTKTGIVTADSVRVRAGSVLVPPANAHVQVILKKSTKVQIIGQRDDFYKIVPPANCYFWVSLDFIKKAGPAEPGKLANLRNTASRDVASAIEKGDDNYMLQLPEYKKLAKQFRDEQAKPLKERDFTALKEQVAKFIASAKTDSIKNNAQSLAKSIEHAETTLRIYKQSLANDEKLRAMLAEIDEKIQKTIVMNNPPGKAETDIIVKGRLAKSAVFTAGNKNQRFIVFDENDTIIYYAISEKDDINLADWTDKYVSLMGEVKYDLFGRTKLLYVKNITEVPKK